MPIDRKKLWRKVPGIIRHDFVRKVLALLLALIVYAAVTDKMGVERDIHNVAVEIPAAGNGVRRPHGWEMRWRTHTPCWNSER